MWAGVQLIADFWGGKVIKSVAEVKKLLIGAARAANTTPLEIATHRFLPQGITGVLLIKESHISLHTWPEVDYIAIDVFTCGDKAMPDKALDYLRSQINPAKEQIREIKRGLKKL